MPDLPLDVQVPAPLVDEAALRRRAEIGSDGLRSRVARGTIINTVYLAAVNALSIVQGLLVARLLGANGYGLWGLLTISFGTLFALAALGLDDKYIQQDHPDQQAAFEIAFTLQAIVCGTFTIIALVATPLFSLLYDQPRILFPGLVLAAALPLIALQTPMWIFYRRMKFSQARFLEGINPAISFLVTVPLVIAGVGFWSLVIGTLCGAIVATVAAVRMSPYQLRFRYERGAMREYASFSWPLLVNSAGGVLTAQIPIVLATRTIGVAAVGAITLTSQITQYAYRVDGIVTHALYPAICAVKSQRSLLFESFSKANRLAILWGFPAGIAAALFARPAVHFVLGDRWKLAIPLIVVLGISAAVDQIGFNWTAFVRARAETRILAVQTCVVFILVLGVGVPLMLAHGLPGFAVGIGAGMLGSLCVRLAYLVRLFPALRVVGHILGAVAPTLGGAAIILLGRALIRGGQNAAARALIELLVYIAVVGVLTWTTERSLLRESASYLRRATTLRIGA